MVFPIYSKTSPELMKTQANRFLAISSSVLFATISWVCPIMAAPLYKNDNAQNLNLLTSWSTTSGAQTPNPLLLDPADVWYFNDATMLGSKTVALGGDLTIAGLGLDNTTATSPGNTYNVVISSGNTLTLNGGAVSGTGVSGGSGYTTAGVVLNRGVGGALTIDANILVGATQQWVTSRGLTIGGNVDLGSGTARTLTVNTATTTLPTITGTISGTTGNLIKSGNGTLYLNNTANSFGGVVTVAGGTLKIDKLAVGTNNSSIGSGSSSIVLNGGTLNYVGSTIDTTDRAIEMRAGAAINNNGIGGQISFTATNVGQTLTGSARTLTLGGSNANNNTFGSILGDSTGTTGLTTAFIAGVSTITLNSVTGIIVGATITGTGIPGATTVTAIDPILKTVTLSAATTGAGAAGQAITVPGVINLSSLTKSGLGKWILSASNSYTGTTNVNAGTLVLGNATNTIADTANITVNGGTLDIAANNDTVAAVTLTTGSITGTSGVLTGSSYAVSAGSITAGLGGTGALTKSGTGTVTLTGTNTYNGTTAVNDGLLVFGTKAAQSVSTTVTSLAAGTVGLGVHNSNSVYFNPTEVAALFSGSLTGFTLDAASAIAVDTTNSGGSFDQNVAITGSRSLVKIGTGTLSLTVANSHTGTTRINQGIVSVTGSGVLGGASGSTTDTNNIVFGQNLNSGALNFETVTNLGLADQIRFSNPGGTDGQGGALIYTGTTDQTLAKTLFCNTSIGIRLESNSVGGRLIFNGAFSQTNRRIYLGGTGIGDNTLATAFAGTGGITKRDAGTWILTGTNTYNGATTINGGTLALGASNVLANTAVSISAATLATAAAISDTVGTLDPTAAATIQIGAGSTLAFAASNAIDWTDGTLNITGSFVPGDLGSLRFGDSLTKPGLTPGQLSQITAAGFTGFGLDANGYLTATAASGYSAWATTNSTAGTINQDHDNDGVSNGIEYFLGGNIVTTGFTALPGVTNTGGTLSVTWTKATGYTGAYGIDFRVETSDTLTGAWSPEDVAPTLGAKVFISGNNVTYTFPTGPVKKFARLKVTGP